MKLVKLVTPAAIAILLLVISCAGPATLPTPGPQAEGRTIVVTSTADSGSGTLRQVLLDAQSGDTITFDTAIFPPSAPATISLTSGLPDITQGNLKIDASNTGVILDGSNISEEWVYGLGFYSDGNTVHGLQIVNFSGVGIFLSSGAQYNIIGGDRSVGSGPLGQGNLVSGNRGGIQLSGNGTSRNTITGNLVGTDAAGLGNQGNYETGIYVSDGASYNLIGLDNIIAYNHGEGIQIYNTNSVGNTITQNSIHDNGVVGIFLNEGGNISLPAPFILDFDLAAGTVTGFTGADCTVEVYSDSGNQGEVYEGQATADNSGFFAFGKGASFTGLGLTTTATDADGNTSEFSTPTSGTYKSTLLQEGNNLPRTQLQPKQSNELEDNRIGIHFNDLWKLEPEVFPEGVLDASHILKQGMKRARFAINNFDSDRVHWSNPENIIDPSHDDFITSLADNGITLTYVLSFWDKEYVAQGGKVLYPRFKTEDDIQRYLDFVQFIVHHFKDRIQYYEIWNEPDIRDTIQWIEVEDYIKLVKRTIPVIRQEYPEAKIVVGGLSYLIQSDIQEYLFTILRSDDIMPLVDVISFHSMYGTSPEYDLHKQYYYNYPSLIQEIKDTASAHGFTGEYVADELSWLTPECPAYPETYYSETKCAKYYARGIMMNLGIDVIVSQFYAVPEEHPMQIVNTIRNLATVMAGNKPIDLPIEIQSEATNIKSYSFSLSNGDRLFALWTDGIAVDYDPGIEATLTLPGFSAQKVVGIDVLNGFEQELITNVEDGNMVISNLLVKDYPIILRLTP